MRGHISPLSWPSWQCKDSVFAEKCRKKVATASGCPVVINSSLPLLQIGSGVCFDVGHCDDQENYDNGQDTATARNGARQ